MFASIAVKSLCHFRLAGINFAAIIAEALQEEKAESTMKRELAVPAEKNLLQTNTHMSNIVPESAQISFVGIKAINPVGIEPVYNMEVEELHNFSVNGGIVVHNCMDAMRYLIATTIPGWRLGEVN